MRGYSFVHLSLPQVNTFRKILKTSTDFNMLFLITLALLLFQGALSAPVESVAAATVGKIRGVREPIYHLYLQANPKNGMRMV